MAAMTDAENADISKAADYFELFKFADRKMIQLAPARTQQKKQNKKKHLVLSVQSL